eukprot:scaffold912_cov422-Prasinococcus_capsulatus_cf.AAC.19
MAELCLAATELQDTERVSAAFWFVDVAAEQASEFLIPEMDLFPRDVLNANGFVLSRPEEVKQRSAQLMEEIHSRSVELESLAQEAHHLDQPTPDMCARIAGELKTLDTSTTQFQHVYATELRPWVSAVGKNPLVEIGPCATRSLDTYKRFSSIAQHMRWLHEGIDCYELLGEECQDTTDSNTQQPHSLLYWKAILDRITKSPHGPTCASSI